MAAPAATAASEHPVPAHAVAECAGELLESGDGPPTALWVVVGLPFAGALGEVCTALTRLLSARSVVGMAAAGLVLGGRVCRDGPALGVLATWDGGIRAHWLAPGDRPAQLAADPDATALVAADPFSVRPGDLGPGPGPTVAGGFLAGGAAPGTNRIVVDGTEHAEGAAVWVCPPGTAEVHMSHGTAPLAGAMEVTATLGSLVTALDGLPAAEAFETAVARAPEAELADAAEVGLRVPGSGELLAVRRAPEGLEVRGDLRAGDTVEPAVRSPASCAAELAGLPGRRGAAPGSAALAFLDVSRPAVARDAAALADVVGSADTGLLAGGVFSGSPAPVVVRGAATVAVLGGVSGSWPAGVPPAPGTGAVGPRGDR